MNDSFIELEYPDMFRSGAKNTAFPKVQRGERHTAAIALKDYPKTSKFLWDVDGLFDHIFILHEDLIELA
jgi:hypothetical protein